MLPQKFVLLLQQTSKNNQLLVTKLVPFSFVHQSGPLKIWINKLKIVKKDRFFGQKNDERLGNPHSRN